MGSLLPARAARRRAARQRPRPDAGMYGVAVSWRPLLYPAPHGSKFAGRLLGARSYLALAATWRSQLLGARGLQDRREPRNLALDQFGQRLRTAALRLGDVGAESGEAFLHGRLVQSLVESVGQLVDDILRRALRRKQRIERGAVELRQALLQRR